MKYLSKFERFYALLFIVATGACAVQNDKFIEFKSAVGNTIVAPSQWKAENQGSVWTLTSPDNHAVITVFTFTVDGSGSIADLRSVIITNSLPDVEGGWEEGNRPSIALKQAKAEVTDLKPATDTSNSRFRLYMLRAGRMYHVLALSADEIVLNLNGGFYDEMIQSFVGIE